MLEKSEQVTEEELVERCRAGDVDAFQLLFRKYGDMMQVIAARMAVDKHMRKDIFQEAATLVLKRFVTFEGRSSLSTWLYRITINTALKMLRKEKRYTPLTYTDEPYSSDDLCFDIERKEMVSLLKKEIARLPRRQRECASMFYFAEMSIGEISEALSIKESAVKIALFKARRNITLKLCKKGVIS